MSFLPKPPAVWTLVAIPNLPHLRPLLTKSGIARAFTSTQTQKNPGKPYLEMVEHSICQPGLPFPHGEAQNISWGLAAFQRAKSLACRLSESPANDTWGINGRGPRMDKPAQNCHKGEMQEVLPKNSVPSFKWPHISYSYVLLFPYMTAGTTKYFSTLRWYARSRRFISSEACFSMNNEWAKISNTHTVTLPSEGRTELNSLILPYSVSWESCTYQ